MRRVMGLCATGLTAAWIAAVSFAASGVPVAAQDGRRGAEYFPNVALTTHEGRTVRFYDDLIKGKIVAVNLIYTSCKYACPLETARLRQVYKLMGERMGRDVFFYSISIDPEVDTPAVLKAYAEKFNAGPGWTFLTGKKSDIDLISKKLGLYSDPAASADGHTPHLLIGNEATGQWIRNNALDNPRYLATTIGNWMNSWQTAPKLTKSYTDAPAINLNAGEYAFKTHCAPCHTIGGGDQIGPDLLGVTARRNRAWLTRFIVDPDKMIAERDPVALALLAKYKEVRMPSIGLANADAALVLDYIAKQRAPRPHPGPALTTLIEPYLKIQPELSADRLNGVAVQARAIAADAAKRGAAAEEIRTAAAGMAGQASDLTAARRAFARLGDAIIRYANDQNSRLDAGVKVAFCPMANKHWLQRGGTISNPYYGRAMSDCGRFVAAMPTGPTW
jgi:protein SCO1/2